MIINADNIDTLRTMEPDSVDSIVTDPPYGLSFMAEADMDAPKLKTCEEFARTSQEEILGRTYTVYEGDTP